MKTPVVSVIMITYNHQPFIAQAIDGVLMQRTSFDFELIVCDDCSSDDTSLICREYARKDSRIRYRRNSSNFGATKNFRQALEMARGHYLAFCEGDDYWTDAGKLQKQTDLLAANEEIAICFHDVYRLIDGEIEPNSMRYDKEVYDICDLAEGNFMHTPTVVCKKIDASEIPGYLDQLHVGDYIIHMHVAKKGSIRYVPEPMAVYRIHHGGAFSTKSESFVYECIAQYLDKLRKDNFAHNVKAILRKRLVSTYYSLWKLEKKKKYLFKLAAINPFKAIRLTFNSFS